jgi:hypothetical protein
MTQASLAALEGGKVPFAIAAALQQWMRSSNYSNQVLKYSVQMICMVVPIGC